MFYVKMFGLSITIDRLIDHVDEGETTSLNSGRQQACFSSPKRYIRMMLTKEILINPPKLCSNPTSRVIW